MLDVAIERGIDYGGWCPKDGWAADLSKPPGLLAKYPKLKETPLPDPAQRTEWNVRDADACMIVIAAGGLAVSKGTALAEELAHRHRKPLLVVDLAEPEPVEHAALWLRASWRAVWAGLAVAAIVDGLVTYRARIPEPEPVEHAALWLRVQHRRVGADLVLAIGGPRESEAPCIYASATAFIHALLDLAAQN